MNKERFIAFTDAVLAIIMTILVLELDKPDELTFQGFWELRDNFLAYLLSFSWIGSVWLSLNSIWDKVERISASVIWCNFLFLFFLSMMPYATGLVSNNFGNRTAQAFYGIIVIGSTCSNWLLHLLVERPNAGNTEMIMLTKEYRRLMIPDIIIKVIGLILALTVYPSGMMIAVFVAISYFQIAKIVAARRRKKKAIEEL